VPEQALAWWQLLAAQQLAAQQLAAQLLAEQWPLASPASTLSWTRSGRH
jgi:hypothetical protein